MQPLGLLYCLPTNLTEDFMIECHHFIMILSKECLILCICSAIKQGFPLSKMTAELRINLKEFKYEIGIPYQNNPKNLDPSYKMDLDFWDCFGREKVCLMTEETW